MKKIMRKPQSRNSGFHGGPFKIINISYYMSFILDILNAKLIDNFFIFSRPVNLVDSYENRLGFACAFGTTVGKLLNILIASDFKETFDEDIQALQNHPSTPSWAGSQLNSSKAYVLL